MSNVKTLESKLLSGELSAVDFMCDKLDEQAEIMKVNNPDMLWTLDIQKVLWTMFRDAHKNGKKLIFYGGSVPTEIIAAFDCVPMYLDSLPFRLCTDATLTARFIDASENYVGASMCGLNKVEMGALLLNQYGVTPDAFVYSSVPCDSSRISFPNMEQILKIPTYKFDTPFRRDEKGYDYLADQIEDFIVFMEELTGKKLDWEKLKPYMETSNQVFELQKKCADLRKNTPCPLPGRLLISNASSNAMACFPELVDVMNRQYEMGSLLVEMGLGPCPDGEKYRIVHHQNMLWSWPELNDWLEQEYGAIIVMDVFGFQGVKLFDDLNNRRECLRIMGMRMQDNPMVHGASGPSEHHVALADRVIEEYKANVSFFVGHVGCKHTWASAKMVSDMVHEKYGMPTLYVDVDCVDGRYKSREDIKAEIAQYMETVVMK